MIALLDTRAVTGLFGRPRQADKGLFSQFALGFNLYLLDFWYVAYDDMIWIDSQVWFGPLWRGGSVKKDVDNV